MHQEADEAMHEEVPQGKAVPQCEAVALDLAVALDPGVDPGLEVGVDQEAVPCQGVVLGLVGDPVKAADAVEAATSEL